jgi:UDP-2,3-diacylglucosamine pyrophosphatase LpxH
MPGTKPQDAVIISDIHLGSPNCQAKLLGEFLESMLDQSLCFDRLIIAGDVFDSIDFRRLKKTHWKILSLIRHLSDKMAITWICGNHDVSAEIISHLLGVDVKDEYVLESGNRKIMIIHGHVFDEFIDDHPILTAVADSLYNLLQRVDRTHYVARLAKKRSKTFVHCVDKIEARSREFARKRGCDAVVCGHTHHAVAKPDGPVHYFNSGCWTELPATYLTVDQGVIALCHYSSAAGSDLLSMDEPSDLPSWRSAEPEVAAV